MKKILSVATLCCIFTAECATGSSVLLYEDRFVLAERGKRSTCVIEVDDDTAPSVNYAAQELRDYLKKITGEELFIEKSANRSRRWHAVVSIGLTNDPSLGDDGFEIFSTKDSLSVKGGKRGVIYGVYEVLERYGGVLWLSPEYIHISEAESFSVPTGLALREVPAFSSRFLSTYDRRKFQDFGVRLRQTEFLMAEKFGGCIPSFDNVLGKCHTFHCLVPAYKYYKTHPEYFSLVKGRRLRERTQLCLTNPDVFAITLSNVLVRIEANKTDPLPHRRAVRFYGVSQNDWNNYCECENCAAIDAREESHAGCVIWFVNKIAEAVEKKYPDVMIETLAYMYSRKPPKYLKPRDNVMICLCTIECDFSMPMSENRYKENIDFRRNILRWRDISKHLYLWDYAANWRATPVPYPNLKAYVENIRFYHNVGVRYLYEEGFPSPSASFTDLKGWLGAKLMWNPFQPAAPLVRRFCDAYYGKGAPFVRDFIKLMGEQDIDETKTPLTYAVTLEKMPFKQEFYEKGQELWKKAESVVTEENGQIRKNVAWGRFGLEYALAARYAQMGEWRAANVSSNLTARLDRTEFHRRRESARYCQRLLDSDSKAMVSSRLNDFRLRGYLRALAEAEFPDAVPTEALIQDWAFNYDDFPKSKTISRGTDNWATDRSVIQVKGETKNWSLTCPVNSVLALDRGTRYKICARIKMQRPLDAPNRKTIFSMGLFDRAVKKDICWFAMPSERATGEFEWYEIGEWTDEGHDCTISINPSGSTFTFDCVKISVVGMPRGRSF